MKQKNILRSLFAGGGIFFLGIFSFVPTSFSDEVVHVSASVGALSSPPTISSITPSSNPVVIAHGSVQTFSIGISDSDSPLLAYTVTAANGSVLKSSGNLAVSGGRTSLGFTYFAPGTTVGFTSIIVTLNDLSGSAPVVRMIRLYVY